VILPVPFCSCTSPRRTTNASPFLNAATATVFGKGCGSGGGCSEPATALGIAMETQRVHAIARESHIERPPKNSDWRAGMRASAFALRIFAVLAACD